MDEIRRRAAARLKELGLSQSWLSTQLGRNRGYVYEYLEEGSPHELPYETKQRIAGLLKMSTRELGIGEVSGAGHPPRGFSEDCEAYEPPPHHYLARAPHIGYFRMKSRALDQHPERIVPGDLLAFNLNMVKPAEIDSGAIVVVQLYDKKDLTRTHGTVIRQFITPNKLITNSSEGNEMLSLDDQSQIFEPVIKGALLSVVRELN